MNNQLYIEDHILMVSTYPVPEKHKHLALHLIFADTGTLHCSIEEKEIDTKAIMIASDVMHTVFAKEGNSIVLLFDAASVAALQINWKFLRGAGYCELSPFLAEEIQGLWKKARGDLKSFDCVLFELLGLQKKQEKVMDDRILQCIGELKRMDSIPENVYSLACQKACLSPSRFSHLFRQTLGISFKQYLVMLKLRKAYEWYLKGMNITEISMRAGFDSPSHFAATMRRSFGVSFSDFSKNMQKINGAEK